ncbi:serine carboxypeptidase 24-like isoform X3 [Rutidosis leptorrhynchoides]|uniref:serine carboxypeptidase 24-like isoform X3 n=1 Tax=Rutidosis leptorrhynchoides TaxID=125765 RepID=UPI003A9A30DC
MLGQRRKLILIAVMNLQQLFVMCLFLITLITTVSSLTQEQENDRITALPGQPAVEFSQFSGYVTVHKKHGRGLFYWLTEAVNPQDKPLVLWLNGGPGCSSIAYGASEEIGPFRIHKNASSLYLNKYSWNLGHYVPQLAKKIHNYNKNHPGSFINLKGFIVGNAVTDNQYDNIGTVDYWWSHSIISDTAYKSIKSSCNFKSTKYTEKCDNAIDYAWNNEFGEIDQYSIYTPSCNKSSVNVTSTRLKNSLMRRRVSGYDPCIEKNAEKYFNRPEVQQAMHANNTGIAYKWTACSDELLENWKDSQFSMLPTYKKLIAAGYRIWVFSGDTDSVVPVTATRMSLSHLDLTVKTPWYPWYSKGQVAGWTEVYEGLTFATVRGAGHEVPLFQPKRAFLLFQRFLAGKNLPKS